MKHLSHFDGSTHFLCPANGHEQWLNYGILSHQCETGDSHNIQSAMTAMFIVSFNSRLKGLREGMCFAGVIRSRIYGNNQAFSQAQPI